MKKVIITEKEYRILKEMGENLESIIQDEVEYYEREYVLTIPHSMFVKKVRDVVNRAIKIKHYLPDSDEFEMFVFDDLYDYFED